MKHSSRLIPILCVIALPLLLFTMGCEGLKWRLITWQLGVPQPGYSVIVDPDVMIPMRDGVRLAADVYRPTAAGTFPVIVTRTPYGKKNPEHMHGLVGRLFASQG